MILKNDIKYFYGELAEWSKAPDWKSGLRESVTRVRISYSPNF